MMLTWFVESLMIESIMIVDTDIMTVGLMIASQDIGTGEVCKIICQAKLIVRLKQYMYCTYNQLIYIQKMFAKNRNMRSVKKIKS